MSKFGDLIKSEVPILIDFYTNWEESHAEQATEVLMEVATFLGERAKVIKIDVEKNEVLAKALRIKNNPTFIIYQNNEMKWRQSGVQDASTLIDLVEQFA
ncbi:MAG: thioredoxin family protein [Bacteroidales bacterium]|nr:thioredoxin family protein [Bacteroidales bacterium]